MTLPSGYLYETTNPTGQWGGVFVRRYVDAALPVDLAGCPAGTGIRWLEEADSTGRTRRKAVSFLNVGRTR